jgi:hypothetical protein
MILTGGNYGACDDLMMWLRLGRQRMHTDFSWENFYQYFNFGRQRRTCKDNIEMNLK